MKVHVSQPLDGSHDKFWVVMTDQSCNIYRKLAGFLRTDQLKV